MFINTCNSREAEAVRSLKAKSSTPAVSPITTPSKKVDPSSQSLTQDNLSQENHLGAKDQESEGTAESGIEPLEPEADFTDKQHLEADTVDHQLEQVNQNVQQDKISVKSDIDVNGDHLKPIEPEQDQTVTGSRDSLVAEQGTEYPSHQVSTSVEQSRQDLNRDQGDGSSIGSFHWQPCQR